MKAELPKIVRERLRAGEATEHPDANLLAAFAEHTLMAREQAQVLEHLSRCEQCREVVVLAQPDAEPAPVVVERNWWRSPVVHWAALTTAALIVLVAVANPPHRQRMGYQASAPVVPAPSAQRAEPEPPAAPAAQTSSVQEKAVQEKKQASRKPIPASPSAGSKISTAVGAAESTRSFYHKAIPAPVAPPPATREQGLSSVGAVAKDGHMQDKAAAATGGAPSPPSRATVSQSVDVTAAAPATSSESVELAEAAPTMRRQSGMAAHAKSSPMTKPASLGARWSISISGTVQQSFDGGRSWREVPVAEGVTFRAVSVAGSDIWAGGSGGALFHSPDGGERWSRVRVQSGDQALNGDIVRVDFSDPANGIVTTSTKETWATVDAGATWKRQ